MSAVCFLRGSMMHDQKIDAFLQLHPKLFYYLRKFSWENILSLEAVYRNDLVLTLSNGLDLKAQEFAIQFIGAVNIKIGQIAAQHALLIDIQNISHHQLEGIKYRVAELEGNAFSFECSDFNLETTSPV